MFNFFSSVVTGVEIKQAMFSLNKDLSGGPDGFNAFFFTTCWHVVQDDVLKDITHFFKRYKMHNSFNTAYITLIPKSRSADNVQDFCPIFLLQHNI